MLLNTIPKHLSFDNMFQKPKIIIQNFSKFKKCIKIHKKNPKMQIK